MSDPKEFIEFVRHMYGSQGPIPLHAPNFGESEAGYISETLASTFVSTVGGFVDKFEAELAAFTDARGVVTTSSGTAGLHTALYLANVKRGDMVITQALTFVATCNAISQLGAEPIFIDVEQSSLGMCPSSLSEFLEENAELKDGVCYLKNVGSAIKAVVPMHTFGHPAKIDLLLKICKAWKLKLIEDAAEGLGSFYKEKHLGTFGDIGVLSFNGNKIITTGGGGALLCQNDFLKTRAKHITTTSKVTHPYEFIHDELGFNYRMPNLNAALGCGQLERLRAILKSKRSVALAYEKYFAASDCQFVSEPKDAVSNFWLNSVICSNADQAKEILEITNANGVTTRPIWRLMHFLPMFSDCVRGPLEVSEWLALRTICLPSSPIWGDVFA